MAIFCLIIYYDFIKTSDQKYAAAYFWSEVVYMVLIVFAYGFNRIFDKLYLFCYIVISTNEVVSLNVQYTGKSYLGESIMDCSLCGSPNTCYHHPSWVCNHCGSTMSEEPTTTSEEHTVIINLKFEVIMEDFFPDAK